MDFKKIDRDKKKNTTTITRNLAAFDEGTHNVYETVAIIAKRANQIQVEMKEEIKQKIAEFGGEDNSLDEKFENKEQEEISKFYEHLPKPSLIATKEYLEGKIHWRNPKENDESL